MNLRPLGTSPLSFSPIGYGAWEASEHWGAVDKDAIIETIHSAIDAGMNWIDTAEVYGPHTSERLVGEALREHPDVMVATKVGPAPAGTGFGANQVREACEASLGRLGRETIDLFQLHWPDTSVPIEETWTAMAALVDDGLARAIGVSNFSRSLIESCEEIRHVDSLQPHASMLHRDNLDLIAWCGEHGIGVLAYSPLACGLLTGKIGADTTFQPGDWRTGERGFVLYESLFGSNLERNLGIVERLRPIAGDLDVALADLAIAWLLAKPGLTCAIIGSRNPKHVAANTAAADITLDDLSIKAIDAAIAG